MLTNLKNFKHFSKVSRKIKDNFKEKTHLEYQGNVNKIVNKHFKSFELKTNKPIYYLNIYCYYQQLLAPASLQFGKTGFFELSILTN